MKNVFKVYYECSNCGHDWSKSYPNFSDIRQGADCVVVALPSKDFLYKQEKLKCSVCGNYRIKVMKRNPIKKKGKKK